MGPALQWFIFCRAGPVCPAESAVVMGRRAGGSPPYAGHDSAAERATARVAPTDSKKCGKRGVGDAAPYGRIQGVRSVDPSVTASP